MPLTIVQEGVRHGPALRALFSTLPWSVMSMPHHMVAEDSSNGALGAVRYDKKSGFISLLIVAEQHQRRGVGAALLQHAVSAIDAPAAPNLLVLAEDLATKPWLLAFYNNHGFEVHGPAPDQVAAGEDVRMFHAARAS